MAIFGFSPNCQTTAMGIMPHTDIEKALEVALSLDIPFWPQLPKVSFFEDMYVQALENFPGVRIDPVHQKIYFDLSRKGVDCERLLRQSLLAPATCNLLNPDKEKTVEKAFEVLKELSKKNRMKYGLT